MENRTIQITPTIIGVVVPSNAYDIKGQTFSNEHQNKWQSAESKTVKGKILIIEKI